MNVNTSSSELNTPPASEKLSEAEFLRREKHEAQAALKQSVESLKHSLKSAADLKLWAEHHPWLTVGAAAAAGFAAGSTLAGGATSASNGHVEPPRFTEPRSAPQGSTLSGMLMGPLFDLAKVAIQSAIASAMGGAMQAQAQDQANQERAAETAGVDTSPV